MNRTRKRKKQTSSPSTIMYGRYIKDVLIWYPLPLSSDQQWRSHWSYDPNVPLTWTFYSNICLLTSLKFKLSSCFPFTIRLVKYLKSYQISCHLLYIEQNKNTCTSHCYLIPIDCSRLRITLDVKQTAINYNTRV